jgi:uncharacterized membrane protein
MENPRRRLHVQADEPGVVEIIIILSLAAFAIGLALGLHIWIPLAVIAWFVASAFGFSPWLGVGAVGVLFLVRLAWGK